MKLTNYANACCVMEARGFRVLTDPWLVDGVFEGSWCHYPPLKTKPSDLADVDAIFVSHVHPDHCDPASLEAMPRTTPILVLDNGPNFLHRVLRGMGFENLIAIRDGERAEVGPFGVTLYAPFTTHIFHESRIGGLIDCAAIFEADGQSVFNFNDNTPDLESAGRLRERHGRPAAGQIAYNAAGPYPASFDNLSENEKLAASDRILQRNLDLAARLGAILEPAWQMPFAGSYVLAGSQWRKNACLGATSPDGAGDYLAAANPDIPVLLLNEGQSIDLATGARSPGGYKRVDRAEELAYIETCLAGRAYTYEADPAPDFADMAVKCAAARARLWSKQQTFDFFPDLDVAIAVGSQFFVFNMARLESGMAPTPAEGSAQRIVVRMDDRLLARIVNGSIHWNNAEVGSHMNFVREPDIYVRDFHTLMSFFAA